MASCVQIPGGGGGIFQGCGRQFGNNFDYGRTYGGVWDAGGCSGLPSALRAGCQFRFGWFEKMENPRVTYQQVTCPSELTNISQCTQN